jgi:hypothetical protein
MLSFEPVLATQHVRESPPSAKCIQKREHTEFPRTAPAFPGEIWDKILNQLGTLVLKHLRLVCREWSQLATVHLYSTLHLNAYEKCWSGLVAVANSRHARLVTRLVWNPLMFVDGCLDAAVWLACFPHMTRGLSHSALVRLHEAFVIAYKKHLGELRSSSWTSISKALGALENCHEVALSDGDDLETQCKDPRTREAVLSDLELLHRPNTWSLSPRKWKPHLAGEDPLSEIAYALKTLSNLPAVHKVSFTFWASSWPDGVAFTPISDWPGWTGVSCLALCLKVCAADVINGVHVQSPLSIGSLDMFEIAKRFPDTEKLIVESVFAEPSEIDMKFLLRACGPEDPHFSLQDFVNVTVLQAYENPATDPSHLATLHAASLSLDRRVYQSACAELCPSDVLLPKLRTVQLSDLSVDARLLLFWLYMQRQLPQSRLQLELCGTIIIHSLDAAFVQDALRALNVELDRRSDDVLWYPHLATCSLQNEILVVYDHRNHRVKRHQWPVRNCREIPALDAVSSQAPEGEPKRSTKPPCAQIVTRPDVGGWLSSQAFQDWERSGPYRDQHAFCYQAQIEDDIITWDWVALGPGGSPTMADMPQIPGQRTYTMMPLLLTIPEWIEEILHYEPYLPPLMDEHHEQRVQ